MKNEIEIKLLVVGHPRCGSRTISKILEAAGLSLGHERIEADGMVSWWHAGRRINSRSFTGGTKDLRRIHAGLVAHYLRHPGDAIPSIIVENEQNGRSNNSFQFRRGIILERCGVDIDQLDPISAAAASYVHWNDFAALASDLTKPILVEAPDLSELSRKAKLANLIYTPTGLRLNTTQQKFGVEKPSINLNDILDAAPSDVGIRLKHYLAIYDEAAIIKD